MPTHPFFHLSSDWPFDPSSRPDSTRRQPRGRPAAAPCLPAQTLFQGPFLWRSCCSALARITLRFPWLVTFLLSWLIALSSQDGLALELQQQPSALATLATPPPLAFDAGWVLREFGVFSWSGLQLTSSRQTSRLELADLPPRGLGFSLSHPLPLPGLSAELAVVYLNHDWRQTSRVAATTLASWRSLQVPLLLRYAFPPYFSVGLGGYWNHFLAGVAVSSLDSRGNVQESSFQELAWPRDDFGLQASIQASFQLTEVISAQIDQRFSWGLTTLDPTGTIGPLRLRELQSWAGLALAL